MRSSRIILACTNDLHSHCHRYEAIQRTIAKCVDGQQAPVLQLDAGDWYSGTLYSWLGPRSTCEACPELEYFARYSVYAALGNHEFDSTVHGLANMLGKAKKLGYRGLVCSNVVLTEDSPLSQYFSSDVTRPNVLNECLVVNVESLGNVGIIGLMGNDAAYGCKASILGSGVSFLSLAAADVKCVRLVQQLKEVNTCRIVILLLHGTSAELERLNVLHLVDFCVEGHTHESYSATVSTVASQAQAYGSAVGVHQLVIDEQAEAKSTHTANLVSSSIVPVADDAGVGQHHSSYHTCLLPLLEDLGLVDDAIPYSKLPEDAVQPLERTFSCSFARWVCDRILTELNFRLRGMDRPIEGFLIANELIRGDFTTFKQRGFIRFFDVGSILEVGQSDAESVGVDILVVDTTMRQLWNLHAAFVIGTHLVTANAVPAYSSGLFLNSVRERLAALVSGRTIRIAMTKFLADSLRANIPSAIFDTGSVIATYRASLSVLLHDSIVKIDMGM